MAKSSIDTPFVDSIVKPASGKSDYKNPISVSGDFGVPTVIGVGIGDERRDLLDSLKSLG